MRETTKKRYKRIYKRYQELLGTDSVMNIYYRLADEFDMSVDRIRQIIAMLRGKGQPSRIFASNRKRILTENAAARL